MDLADVKKAHELTTTRDETLALLDKVRARNLPDNEGFHIRETFSGVNTFPAPADGTLGPDSLTALELSVTNTEVQSCLQLRIKSLEEQLTALGVSVPPTSFLYAHPTTQVTLP